MTVNYADAWIYAYLSELSYRRSSNDYDLDLGMLGNGVQPDSDRVDELNNYVRDQLGLFQNSVSSERNLDFEFKSSSSGGVTNYWNESGFSAFVTKQGSEFIITFRGSDVSGVSDAGASFGAALAGYRIAGDFNENQQVGSHPQHVDEGDWYSNVKLGAGTYLETQYDYALALAKFVIDVLANGNAGNVTLTGQSLGGGLAALVGIELAVEYEDENTGVNADIDVYTFGVAPFRRQLEKIAEKNAVLEILEIYESRFENSSFLELSDLLQAKAFARVADAIPEALPALLNDFIDKYGVSILDILDEFDQIRDGLVTEYIAQINSGNLYFSSVAGEFTTNSGGISSTLGNNIHTFSTDFVSSYDGSFVTGDGSLYLGRELHQYVSGGNLLHFSSTGGLRDSSLGDFLFRDGYFQEGSYRHSPALTRYC